MDLIGEIVPRSEGIPINKQAWIALIDRHPNLARPEERTRTNPFDDEPFTLRPSGDAANVVVNGVEVGTLYWFMDDENGINVMGDPTAVVPVAEDIAKELGAEFRRTTCEDA